MLFVQVVSSHVKWDGRDIEALVAQFRKELEKEKRWCKFKSVKSRQS